MKETNFHILPPEQILLVTKIMEPIIFRVTADICFEKQIPHVGYLLVEGSIHLFKANKLKFNMPPGAIFGLSEMMNNVAIPYRAKVLANTHVCILDKSTIFEFMQGDAHCSLSQLVEQIIRKIA